MEGYERWGVARSYREGQESRAQAIGALSMQWAIEEETGQQVPLKALMEEGQPFWHHCDYCGNRLKEEWLKCKWCGGPRG